MISKKPARVVNRALSKHKTKQTIQNIDPNPSGFRSFYLSIGHDLKQILKTIKQSFVWFKFFIRKNKLVWQPLQSAFFQRLRPEVKTKNSVRPRIDLIFWVLKKNVTYKWSQSFSMGVLSCLIIRIPSLPTTEYHHFRS
jgi:hypothetical protein